MAKLHKSCVMADGGAERRVKYITSFKKQMIGPSEALCIEMYKCPRQPDQAWVVDVQAQTPEVCFNAPSRLVAAK